MKKVILTGSIIASLFAGQSMMAQDALKDGQLTISGQVRPRFEFRNGFKRPNRVGEEPAAFMEQRSRVKAAYKAPKFNMKMSIQDVRIWGDVGQINKSDALTSFHEAYGEWTPDSSIALRIGRQEFVYDNARILGNLDWAAQGRSFDAVKFVYKAPKSEFHFATTYNQDAGPAEPAKLQSPDAGEFNGATSNEGFALSYPLSTQFAWFKTKLGTKGDISFLALNDFTQIANANGSSGLVARGTIGANPKLKFGDFKVEGSFYYQIGKTSGTLRTNGLLANLDLTYTGGKKVTPTIGFDYLSGDDTQTTDVTEGFDPLYGTHHAFYGYMDYFYVGNGHRNVGGGTTANQTSLSAGLVDLYVKSVFKLGKPGKLVAHLHGFFSPTEVIDPTTLDLEDSQGSYLGTELDLVYVKKLSDKIMFKAGQSFMVQTDAMNTLKGAHTDATTVNTAAFSYTNVGLNTWSWAMIDFTF